MAPLNWMTGITSMGNKLIVLACIVLTWQVLAGQPVEDRLRYARSLAEEGDYYRAISEYKAVRFICADSLVARSCSREIVAAYYLSGKYREALRELNRHPVTSPEDMCRANLMKGLAYYRLKDALSAYSYWSAAATADTTGSAQLYLGLLWCENTQWSDATKAFQELGAAHPGQPSGLLAQELATLAAQGNALPRKSPLLATCMAALVPGSGQVYAGHFYDGLMAFFHVGAFSYAGYMAYCYDHDRSHGYLNTPLVFSLDALFYTANLIGAHKTAGYANMRRQEQLLNRIRDRALSLPLP